MVWLDIIIAQLWFLLCLINGQPETPLKCKRGLRQSDPLLLYLFILGVYVLSRMLSLAFEGGLVQKIGP